MYGCVAGLLYVICGRAQYKGYQVMQVTSKLMSVYVYEAQQTVTVGQAAVLSP